MVGGWCKVIFISNPTFELNWGSWPLFWPKFKDSFPGSSLTINNCQMTFRYLGLFLVQASPTDIGLGNICPGKKCLSDNGPSSIFNINTNRKIYITSHCGWLKKSRTLAFGWTSSDVPHQTYKVDSFTKFYLNQNRNQIYNTIVAFILYQGKYKQLKAFTKILGNQRTG